MLWLRSALFVFLLAINVLLLDGDARDVIQAIAAHRPDLLCRSDPAGRVSRAG